MKEYTHRNIYIAYPENWLLEENKIESADGMIHLSNSGGAFWFLKKYPSGTIPDDIADEAVAAMRSEYDDMEIERFDTIQFDKAITGFDMTFFYLDLMNLAKILCYEEHGQTWAIFWQTGNQLIIHNDETVPVEDVLEAITYSVLRGPCPKSAPKPETGIEN